MTDSPLDRLEALAHGPNAAFDDPNDYLDHIAALMPSIVEALRAANGWLGETGPVHTNTMVGRQRTATAHERLRAAITEELGPENPSSTVANRGAGDSN